MSLELERSSHSLRVLALDSAHDYFELLEIYSPVVAAAFLRKVQVSAISHFLEEMTESKVNSLVLLS